MVPNMLGYELYERRVPQMLIGGKQDNSFVRYVWPEMQLRIGHEASISVLT